MTASSLLDLIGNTPLVELSHLQPEGVRIPPTLRGETAGEREVEASGRTVRELLDDLMGRFPTLRSQLLEQDDLAPFVNVYVEGEDVRTKQGLETEVSDGSTVILLPAMAGG